MSARRSRSRAWAGRAAIVILGLACVLFALFVWNGTRETWREPQVGANGHVILQGSYPSGERARNVRVMAFNAAKCDFHRGGLRFASREEVRTKLESLASVIRREDPDVVCLSEVVMEGGPVRIDQVEYLALTCAFAHWASGENYSFGIPGFRIRSGNAVLSNFELRALDVQQLAGGTPFWSPTGNRRALWFEVRVDDAWLLGASIRNDSFDLANNLVQVDELLARIGGRPALIAGDFNAEPGTPPMERWLATGHFAGFAAAPATFPAGAPSRRIDQVLAPTTWTVVDTHVVDTGVSDHLAVITTFRVRD